MALGYAAVEAELNVRFTTAQELADSLYASLADGSFRRGLERYRKLDLLIIDKLGFLNLDKTASSHFFQVVNQAYERHAVTLPALLRASSWLRSLLLRVSAAPRTGSGPWRRSWKTAKYREASAKAREVASALTGPADKKELARVLTNGADQIPVSGDALQDERTADVYLLAGELDPGVPAVYVGLQRLCKGNARLTWQPYNIPVKALILWKDGVSANPGLSKDEAAQEAGCYLAKAISDYVLAAEINPDDIDAQYNAALSLAPIGRTEEALSHAREARRIAGGRADILNLLAALGDLKEAPAEKVLEASFAGPISVRLGAPDAEKAYVTSQQENRCVLSQVSLKDGGVKTLADPCGRSVAISPNGACLAYTTGLQSDVPCEVRVLDLASGKTRCMAGTTGPVLGMTWSPDSRRLAFASRDGLVAVDGDGRNRQTLVSSVWRSAEDYEVPASPQWSPDGTRLLFATSMWERSGPLRVVEVDTGTIIKLTADWAGAGLWSPDGREILYTKMRPGGPNAKVYLLDDLSGNGGDGKCLTEGNVHAFALCWSPDGKQVLITMEPRPWQPGASTRPWLWICDTRTGELCPVRSPGGHVTSAAWALDGTIYYSVSHDLVGMRLR